MKFNIILHTTTSCNYNCSYCDVIKDKKQLSKKTLDSILIFIKINLNNINRFKFFWWEPLLAFENIKYIIDNSKWYIWNNYEIVTNTTLLTDEIWEYFTKYFKIIFFSIDTENNFNYEIIEKFIKKFNLDNKVYFNLVVNPWNENESLEQFKKLYNLGFRWFNILPVYFTKPWTKENLWNLSQIMKYILELSIDDKKLKLYWFQENNWEDISLVNNTIFVDINGKIYYSDIVSTFIWNIIKNDLFLWSIIDFKLKNIIDNNFNEEKKTIIKLEQNIYNNVNWQKELHILMDYFSIYLNKQNGE